MAYVTKTDVGRKRDHNEDACDAFETRINGVRYTVLALADGMGGLEAGEVASSIFIGTVRSVLGEYANGRRKSWRVKKALQDIFAEANRAIHQEGKARSAVQMGTTGVVALIDELDCTLAWVGDSRAYHYHKRDSRLLQISRDHSLVQSLVDAGRLSEEDALIHPKRNVVLRGVGIDPDDGPPDLLQFSLKKGDIIFLCSDGLSNEVPRSFMERNCRMYAQGGINDSKTGMKVSTDTSISGEILPITSLDVIGERLVRAANDNGGKDNITVVIYESPGITRAMAVIRFTLLTLTAVLLVISIILLIKTITLDTGPKKNGSQTSANNGKNNQVPKNMTGNR